MKFVTIDTETSIKNRGEGAIGDFKASPFCKENKIVKFGFAKGFEGSPIALVAKPEQFSFKEPELLVGHNIGFDLLHMLKDGLIKEEQFPNIYIWDTQQVEYLLSGQRHTYPSLDECCEARGLPLKNNKIKEYWDNGIDTELIPPPELNAYLIGDVENTRAIFLDQWATVSRNPALMELVRVKMEDKLSTIWMEWNGMQFDLVTANTLKEDLVIQKENYEAYIVAESEDYWPTLELGPPDPAKNEHVSALLYGGVLKYEAVEPAVDENGSWITFKSGAKKGQIKTKKVLKEIAVVPELVFAFGTETKKKGVYKVDDEVLEVLAKDSNIAHFVQQWRTVTKDISTYYEGYASLVWPDGKIHPSFNHEATGTGRQSCTKPNLQNVTKTEED